MNIFSSARSMLSVLPERLRLTYVWMKSKRRNATTLCTAYIHAPTHALSGVYFCGFFHTFRMFQSDDVLAVHNINIVFISSFCAFAVASLLLVPLFVLEVRCVISVTVLVTVAVNMREIHKNQQLRRLFLLLFVPFLSHFMWVIVLSPKTIFISSII